MIALYQNVVDLGQGRGSSDRSDFDGKQQLLNERGNFVQVFKQLLFQFTGWYLKSFAVRRICSKEKSVRIKL
jgi:hypothetical protein